MKFLKHLMLNLLYQIKLIEGNKSDSKENKGLQDERIFRTIFNQKLNEEEYN